MDGFSPFLMSLLADRALCAEEVEPISLLADEDMGKPSPRVMLADRKKEWVDLFTPRSVALKEEDTAVALSGTCCSVNLLLDDEDDDDDDDDDDDFGRGRVPSKRARSVEGPCGFWRLAGRHTGLSGSDISNDDLLDPTIFFFCGRASCPAVSF
jgi:hypothetical protein